jgi:Xaa-Pro aminopeptidase
LKDYTVDTTHLYAIACESKVHKTEEEIELMQWANIVGQLSHKYIWKRIKPGLSELQISNYFTASVKYLANGTNPYGNICACDKSSASLHYMDGRETLIDGDLILIDCGARVNKYNSDITRTIPVNGKFTTKQKEVYNIVLTAQENVYKLVDIGVSWQDCHIEAEKTILRGLQDLGMISKTISKEIQHQIN